MAYKSVEEYNNYLVDNQIQINIIEYVKEVNKISYNIDISFIDEFIELVNKNECCIHHSMLQKYGIVKLKSGTTDVGELMKQYNFKLGIDFNLRQVPEVRERRGTVLKNEYTLHPRTFKICLMRSSKTKQYSFYYVLLEECIKYYNDYQNSLQQKYIIKLKDKNREKKLLIQQQSNTIKDNKSEIAELKELIKLSEKRAEERDKKAANRAKKLENKLDDTNIKLDITNEELSETLLKK